MNKSFKGKIINALRKLTYSYAPRNYAKKRQKVGPNTFECEHCQIWVYEGTRTLDKQLEILDSSPPNDLVKGRTNLDHKEAVIPLKSFDRGSWDWHEFITRLFCKEEGFQLLCAECHRIKTDLEDEMRKEYRQQKKLTQDQKSDKLDES